MEQWRMPVLDVAHLKSNQLLLDRIFGRIGRGLAHVTHTVLALLRDNPALLCGGGKSNICAVAESSKIGVGLRRGWRRGWGAG
jgi:hypothetical protein